MIPPLHIITDDEVLARRAFLSLARDLMDVGGGAVALHVRGPGTTGRALHSLCEALKGPAKASGSPLLVNDRIDVALALDLPGAHLGQRSLPPQEARRLLGPARLLGRSVHGVEEAREGSMGAVDFFLVGTIFPSASHPGGPTGGPERIRELEAPDHPPLLAIGGITPERVGKVLGAGARGVAVLGGIWNAPDPSAAVRVYLEALREGSRWKGKGR